MSFQKIGVSSFKRWSSFHVLWNTTRDVIDKVRSFASAHLNTRGHNTTHATRYTNTGDTYQWNENTQYISQINSKHTFYSFWTLLLSPAMSRVSLAFERMGIPLRDTWELSILEPWVDPWERFNYFALIPLFFPFHLSLVYRNRKIILSAFGSRFL